MPATAGAIRAGRAFVEFFLDDSPLVRGMKAAGAKLQAFGASVRAAGLRLMAAGAALAAPLAVAARTFMVYGDDLAKAARRMGLTAEALSELQYAATLSGVGVDNLEVSFRRMQRTLLDARAGLGDAQRAYLMLGLSAKDLAALSPEQQFALIADRLSRVSDATQRAGVAMMIFGRSGTMLLPMIEKGAAGIQALREEAQRFGFVLTDEDVRAAVAFRDQMTRLNFALKISRFHVGAALGPALNDLAQRFLDVSKGVISWVREHKGVVITLAKAAAITVGVGAGMVLLGTAIRGVGSAFKLLSVGVNVAGTGLRLVVSLLTGLLSPVGLLVGAVAAFAAYWAVTTGRAGKAATWLGERFNSLKDDAVRAWEGIGAALATGDIGAAVRILWLTIRQWWVKGVDWIEDRWHDFKTVWGETWEGLLAAAEIVWHNLKVGWIDVTAAIAERWTRVVAGLKDMVNWWGKIFKQVGAFLRGLVDENYNDLDAMTQAQQTYQNKRLKLERDARDEIARIEQERQRKRGAETERHEGRLTEIAERAAREKAERDALHAKRDAASQRELAEARKQWEDAIAGAIKRRQDQEAGAAAPAPAGPPKLPDLGALGRAAERLETAAVGTFSAAVAARLGAMGPAERTAKATEETAKNTRRIQQQLEEGGLEFGV